MYKFKCIYVCSQDVLFSSRNEMKIQRIVEMHMQKFLGVLSESKSFWPRKCTSFRDIFDAVQEQYRCHPHDSVISTINAYIYLSLETLNLQHNPILMMMQTKVIVTKIYQKMKVESHLVILAFVLCFVTVNSAYVTYEGNSAILTNNYLKPATTYLLLTFKAGDIITIKSDLQNQLGTTANVKFSLAPAYPESQCGGREINFKAPFFYVVRKSGEYLLTLKNVDLFISSKGKIQIGVDGKIKDFFVHVPSVWMFSSFVYQPIRTPSQSSYHKLDIDSSSDGVMIYSVMLNIGEQFFHFYQEMWGESSQEYTSFEEIPGGQNAYLIIEYSFMNDKQWEIISYDLKIEVGEFCQSGIIDFEEWTCSCMQGSFLNVMNETQSRCESVYCVDFPEECQVDLFPQVWMMIFEYGQTSDQVRLLIRIAINMNYVNTFDQDSFYFLYEGLRCTEYVFGDNFQEVYYALLSYYLDNQYVKMNYLAFLEYLSTEEYFFSTDKSLSQICGFVVDNYTEISNVTNNTDQYRRKTTTAFYFSPFMNTPQALAKLISRLLSLNRASEQAHIDNGIYYVPFNIQEYQMLDGVDYYASMSGLSREDVLDLLITLFSDGMAPIPSHLSMSDYEDLMKFFYTEIYDSLWQKIMGITLPRLQRQIDAGRRVVMIAHSSGADLANHIYDSLSFAQQSSVSLIFLGSVVSPSDGADRYILNNDDYVVQYLFEQYGYYLNPTVTGVTGLLNHEALGYLTFETQFLGFLDSAIRDAVIPDPLPSPELKIQLTWNNTSDSDLYVLEPNGFFVFYDNMQGQFGFLANDNTLGYGPETYYTYSWTGSNENYTNYNETDFNFTDYNDTDYNDTDYNSTDGNQTDNSTRPFSGTFRVSADLYSGEDTLMTIKVYAGSYYFENQVEIISNNQTSTDLTDLCEIMVADREGTGDFQYRIRPL